MIAVDAGLCKFNLREGVSLRCGETVRSGRTHDTARPENWLAGKSIAQAVVEEGARKDLRGPGGRKAVRLLGSNPKVRVADDPGVCGF